MNRRQFLGRAAVTAGAIIYAPSIGAWKGPQSTSFVAPPSEPMSIGSILQTSYAAVLQEMREGRRWVSKELDKYTAEGGIVFTNHLTSRPGMLIEELRVPLVWAKTDEIHNDENQRISLAGCMLENGLGSHDDMFMEKLGIPPYGKGATMRLIVFSKHHYNFGPVNPIPNTVRWVAIISTVFARI